MRKLGTALLGILMVFYFLAPANAATKSATLIKAFQKFQSDGDAKYAQSLAEAKSLYEPQISSAIAKLQAAQSQYLQVNQVTILKTTTHSPTAPIEIDAVMCPSTRPDCKDSSYKSNEFKAGEIASTYGFVGGENAFTTDSSAQMNFGMLQTIDLQVKDGLISLNNPSAYNAVVAAIRSQYQSAVSLSNQYSQAKSDAASALQEVQSMQLAIKSAIISAKRAASNVPNFDKTFIISFKFEYNARRLNDLAREPWTYISSLKALQDAVSVTKQSNLADSISSNFSMVAASKLNSTYGNLFLSEQNFKDEFQTINSIYKMTTGVSLVGK
jgi:hypothetical protein